MEFDEETQKKLQEMQSVEQNLQNFLMQKQNFQADLNEVTSAMEESKKTKDDIYKIVGQVMIKSRKEKVMEELEDKEKTLGLKIKTIEKQENRLKERLEELRKEVEKKFRESGNSSKK